jgi:hypothetical protein
MMISDRQILRAAHLMLHEYGVEAESQAEKYATLMRGCGDRDGLLTWTRIQRSIAAMHASSIDWMH